MLEVMMGIYPYDSWLEERGALGIMLLCFYVTAPQSKRTALFKRAKYTTLSVADRRSTAPVM